MLGSSQMSGFSASAVPFPSSGEHTVEAGAIQSNRTTTNTVTISQILFQGCPPLDHFPQVFHPVFHHSLHIGALPQVLIDPAL